MTKCWAASYSECNDKQSREHLVSRSLFESPLIEIKGFPWCKTPIQIGRDALTRKILCVKHNNLLSELDQAAKDAFGAFRKQVQVAITFPRGTVPTTYTQSVIDALLLERWFLKTLINLSFMGKFAISYDGITAGIPSQELVEIVYGKQPFPGRSGMYIASTPGMTIQSKDGVQFAPLIKKNQYIFGGLFTFRGLHVVLILHPDGIGAGEFAFNEKIDYWRKLSLKRPFDRIEYSPLRYFVAHEIIFDWGVQRPTPQFKI